MVFVERGFLDLGAPIPRSACRMALDSIKASRPFGPDLFLAEEDFRRNPIRKNVNPCPGRNLIDKIDTSFIDDNNTIRDYLRLILGPVTIVMLKKVVAAIPSEWIPGWVHDEIRAAPVPNLGAFIKPEYRDVTYFHGIDWHQDIIDYPDRKADFITLYVYLDDVKEDDSPLFVMPGSHKLGATLFPHNLKKTDDDSWIYSDSQNLSGIHCEGKKLTGPAGSAYLWHALTLHGTQPTPGNKVTNRISIRYLIAKGSSHHYLIDSANREIKGPLSLASTRLDLDAAGKAILKGNALTEVLDCF